MFSQYKVIGFIVLVFHLVGAIGTLLPATRDLVLPLTPLNLILSTGILIYGHRDHLKPLTLFFIISFLIGFSIEVVGVKTGFPFGEYTYGSILGFKFLEVPLTIGLNWFMLSYLFGMLAARVFTSTITRILAASVGMALLDFLLEPVAIHLGYWTWGGSVPLENYLSWLLVSGVLQMIFVFFDFKKSNPVVIPLTIGQVFYFGVIFFSTIF